MVAPGPAYVWPMTADDTFPAAYSPGITDPSGRSTRARSSVTSPPLVPRSPGTILTA